MNKRASRLATRILPVLLLVGCYRESGVEQFTVTGTQATEENFKDLSLGVETSARIGDLVLESTNLQMVIKGIQEEPARDLWLGKNAGAVLDISTQFESGLNRVVVPRHDDGLNQISQGVNMNRNQVIAYHRAEIEQMDEIEAAITLTGSVYDLDGSLAAAGAPVETGTRRVLGCEVTTRIDLTDTENFDEPDTEDPSALTTVSGTPAIHATFTTVITNRAESILPIFTVNDIAVTHLEAADIFVPYPDWGYDIPAEPSPPFAYSPYVMIQPVQRNTSHYAFISRLDGLVLASREMVPAANMDLTFVGKTGPVDRALPPGEAYTFVRELLVLNSGNQISTALPSNLAFNAVVNLLARNPVPGSVFNQTGILDMGVERFRGQGRQIVFSYINETVKYFNGEAYVTLEPGRTFPIFGDRPIQDRYTLPLPPGQIGITGQVLNADPVYTDESVTFQLDSEGNPFEVRTAIVINDETTFTAFGVTAADRSHAMVNLSIIDQNERIRFGRFTTERMSGGGPIETGSLPLGSQGPFTYFNNISQSFLFLPEGEYQVLCSRGPLFNVNFLEVSVKDHLVETGEEEEEEEFVFSARPSEQRFTLGQALTFPGHLSADFGLRTSADPMSTVDLDDVMRMAYGEDLDVVFTANTYRQSRIETLFQGLAIVLGAFSQQDEENNVDSLLDEMIVSRASAAIGKTGTAPRDRGRFALLNLPSIEDVPQLDLPLFESDPASFFDAVREYDPGIVIQVTRPRAPQGFETGMFTAIAALSGVPAGQPLAADNPYLTRSAETGSATQWLDFDILQLLSGNSYGEFLLARQDWFNLLNADIFRPATGGSMPGPTKRLPVGTVRTWVQVSNTTLRENDLQEFWTNVRAGRMFVSNGPLIEADVNGVGFGQTANVTGAVMLHLKVSAAPWIPVNEIRVVVDGTVLNLPLTIVQSDAVRFDGTVEAPVPAGGRHWIVVEAGASLADLARGQMSGVDTFGRVYPGHLPVAFSNPIFIQR